MADIIKKHQIRFPDNIAIAEDAIFVKKYLKFCKKIYVSSKTIYHYNRLNLSSITMQNPYFEKRKEWDANYISVYEDMLSSWGGDEDLVQKEISQKALELFVTNARSAINSFSEKEAISVIENLMESYVKWISNGYKEMASERNKILIDCLLINDAKSIYELLKQNKRHRASSGIKKLIKKIIRPLIEKHRDGLIKFKF